jgi:hypothetical protein
VSRVVNYAGAACIALASCASPLNTVATEEGLLASYEGAELAYLNGTPDRAVVVKLEAARTAANAALAPVEAEIKSGVTPTSNESVALTEAVSGFGAALTAAGVAVPSGS